jgi:[protein-PII] uridylyltransferase
MRPEKAILSLERQSLIDKASLEEALKAPHNTIQLFRDALKKANDILTNRFHNNESIEILVLDRALVIDEIILSFWNHFATDIKAQCALIAVGGYGRGELLPYSDIDLMILLPEEESADVDKPISQFLTSLWDIGLEVGHSVRTPQDCTTQSKNDVTVLTTLMESRLLSGPTKLFQIMKTHISKDDIWESAAFYKAKYSEQVRRHHRYDDTEHNLEPNIKESPGGLRDIQMIGWIARRHLDVENLNELVNHGFLTPGQFKILRTGQNFLWRIRFGLHLLAGRREDRLLFDHQSKLAQMLSYEDATYTLAVEQLMQRYYRTVMELSRLNEMLLQLFEEAILQDPNAQPTYIGQNFQIRNDYLEAVNEDIFTRNPSALLEIFLLLERNLELRGINARTIALIKQHLYLIDEEFRQNPKNHRLFLDIIREPQGVTRTLKRMNIYGVLGLYIPAFGRIVGRMQYDLFHAYTVDAHTLFVVENLRRFALPRFDHEHPDCSGIMQSLSKPEIVYLAGLFHDIAKGRGGDHSTLGAVDAEAFCLEHGMSLYDARLLSWLVKNHLLLSMTSQKKDLNDPNVINDFAHTVGDEAHLDHLYVLTVADVRGTNPKIWNSWKNTLFWELYQLTKRALRRNFSQPLNAEELISETQNQAQKLLKEKGLTLELWAPIWANFTDEYYLRHKPEEIAWHTLKLAEAGITNEFVVDVNDHSSESLTAIMVYAPKQLRSFGRTTAVLDQLGLTVVDARIIPMNSSQTLNTYFILENDGQAIRNARRFQEIRTRILKALTANTNKVLTVNRQAPRQVRMFSTELQVKISQDHDNYRTVLELVTGDRPGLLLQISKIFELHNVSLQNAKITTLGEKAEDIFFITTSENAPLDEQLCNELISTIKTTLSQPSCAQGAR